MSENIPATVPDQVIVNAVEDDPKRPWKSVVPTVITFVSFFVGVWVADTDPFTAKEAASAALGAAAASGLTGAAAYITPNPKRVKR